MCVCEPGFTGADCSLVTCPGDVCEFDYLARKLNCFQCTGRGVCNGFTGECMCTFPAGGPSCNQYECLNDCNGNGVCDKTTANDQGYACALGGWQPSREARRALGVLDALADSATGPSEAADCLGLLAEAYARARGESARARRNGYARRCLAARRTCAA